jgi:tetratricopeptide (TPR) repeat protein
MRKIILLVIILVFISFSPCLANNVSLDKAYSYYFQGKMPEAIKIMKEYVKEKPDARVLYFIGYAYYEMKDMESARRYFEEAYLIDPDFTPLPPNKGGNG